MSQFCRKQYNFEYYRQNKERIKQRRLERKAQKNQTPLSQIQNSSVEIPVSSQNSQTQNQTFRFETLGFLVQGLLIGGITYFLLREAVEFYKSNSSNVEQSILAAVLVESLLIVFAFLAPSKLTSQILVKGVLIILFVYSSWSFSSNVVGEGLGSLAQADILDESIEGLGATIAKNDKAIEIFMKRSWLSAAKKLTNENTRLREKLLELQAQKMSYSARPEETQKSNTIALVALRLILQVSNIILVHQLSSALKQRFWQKKSFYFGNRRPSGVQYA